jgi:hypothetical protein
MVWVCGLSSLVHNRMQRRSLVNTAMNLGCIKAERSASKKGSASWNSWACVHDDASATDVRKHRTQHRSDGWARLRSMRLWRREIGTDIQDSRDPERDSYRVPSLYKSRTLLILQTRRCTVWGKEQEVCSHLKTHASFCRIWYYHNGGSAVAQTVSRWLPTAAAWVRVRAACGVCGGQSGTGAGFLRVLRLPLPIIPPVSPSS